MSESETRWMGAEGAGAAASGGEELDVGRIGAFLEAGGIDLWGVANNVVTAGGPSTVSGSPPRWPLAPDLPFAISLGMRLDPGVIAEVVNGPTAAYYAEYRRLNRALGETAEALAALLREHGALAEALGATAHGAEVKDWTDAGVFPHKTAATQAGLGWIGKTALFVSPLLGPRVRLATVFTDAELPAGEPITGGRCGRCHICVDACPAGAGRDVTWQAGMARAEIYDARACERQCDANKGVGGVCGICIAVCPFGRVPRAGG